MSLSSKTRKLQSFEYCLLASRPQNYEVTTSGTRGQRRLQFWIFTILIHPNKYANFSQILRRSLPGAGWLGVEIPYWVNCHVTSKFQWDTAWWYSNLCALARSISCFYTKLHDDNWCTCAMCCMLYITSSPDFLICEFLHQI
jgi:hypothetical protein